jgi:hypothetical protein
MMESPKQEELRSYTANGHPFGLALEKVLSLFGVFQSGTLSLMLYEQVGTYEFWREIVAYRNNR